MSRLETFSEYVDKIIARLQSGSRSDQNAILVREIAELRLQLRTVASSVAALASYQEISDQLQPTEQGGTTPALPRSVRLDASQHLQLLDGFYALEYTESGQAYRWTGPSRRFRFAVWVDRTVPIDVRLHVIFPASLANIVNTRLFVDDVAHALFYNDSDKVFAATGVPPRAFYGLTIFEFEIASPYEDKIPSDHRELGIPFCAFEVMAQDRVMAAGAASHG
jgi:hypothetical protein